MWGSTESLQILDLSCGCSTDDFRSESQEQNEQSLSVTEGPIGHPPTNHIISLDARNGNIGIGQFYGRQNPRPQDTKCGTSRSFHIFEVWLSLQRVNQQDP